MWPFPERSWRGTRLIQGRPAASVERWAAESSPRLAAHAGTARLPNRPGLYVAQLSPYPLPRPPSGSEAHGSKLRYWSYLAWVQMPLPLFPFSWQGFSSRSSISDLQNGFPSLGCHKNLVKLLPVWQSLLLPGFLAFAPSDLSLKPLPSLPFLSPEQAIHRMWNLPVAPPC